MKQIKTSSLLFKVFMMLNIFLFFLFQFLFSFGINLNIICLSCFNDSGLSGLFSTHNNTNLVCCGNMLCNLGLDKLYLSGKIMKFCFHDISVWQTLRMMVLIHTLKTRRNKTINLLIVFLLLTCLLSIWLTIAKPPVSQQLWNRHDWLVFHQEQENLL